MQTSWNVLKWRLFAITIVVAYNFYSIIVILGLFRVISGYSRTLYVPISTYCWSRVTKQYNLVPANERWRSSAGKVTSGLAESRSVFDHMQKKQETHQEMR